MFIVPIGQTGNLINGQSAVHPDKQSGSSFQSVLDNFINEANTAEQTSAQDSLNLATSSVDDLHTITIDSAKAELALSLLVQIRNKALDAYNDIMRINL